MFTSLKLSMKEVLYPSRLIIRHNQQMKTFANILCPLSADMFVRLKRSPVSSSLSMDKYHSIDQEPSGGQARDMKRKFSHHRD